MKKIVSMLLIFSFIIITAFPVFADDENEEEWDESLLQEELIQAGATTQVEPPKLTARRAVIYDRTSKRVLWGKQENTRCAMASTTKIITCLVVLEKAKLTDVVEISKKAGGTGGSRLGLKAKDKVRVQDLLYGLMLRSGNDSAVALAEHVGGSVAGFAELMNQKAQELGLKDTHFVTPHGLDETEHYTTAYELAVITDVALQNKKFVEIVGTKSCNIMINDTPRTIANTNELLGNLAGVDGVKTGFTNNAGRCLVTSTTREGHQIICVILGADTKKIRTTDSVKLIQYVFSNYEYIDAEALMQEEFEQWKMQNNTLEIEKGKEMIPQIKIEDTQIEEIPILKQDKANIRVELEIIDSIKAPVNSGEVVGKIEIKNKEEVVLSTNIVVENGVDKKNIWDYLKELLSNYTQYIEQGLKTTM